MVPECNQAERPSGSQDKNLATTHAPLFFVDLPRGFCHLQYAQFCPGSSWLWCGVAVLRSSARRNDWLVLISARAFMASALRMSALTTPCPGSCVTSDRSSCSRPPPTRGIWSPVRVCHGVEGMDCCFKGRIKIIRGHNGLRVNDAL